MSDDHAGHEIIIVHRHEEEEHEHHSSAWKVAHADFMTAMMAFFLIMWLINATDEKVRKGISEYFNPIHLSAGSTELKGLNSPNAAQVDASGEKGYSDKNVPIERFNPLKLSQGYSDSSTSASDGAPPPAPPSSPDGEPGKAADGTDHGAGAGLNPTVSADSLTAQNLSPAEQAAREHAAFQDPYAVLSKLAGEATPKHPTSTAVVAGDTRKPGAAGGSIDRDPFDPAYWQLTEAPPAKSDHPSDSTTIAAPGAGDVPDAAAAAPPAPKAGTATPPPAATPATPPARASSTPPPGTKPAEHAGAAPETAAAAAPPPKPPAGAGPAKAAPSAAPAVPPAPTAPYAAVSAEGQTATPPALRATTLKPGETATVPPPSAGPFPIVPPGIAAAAGEPPAPPSSSPAATAAEAAAVTAALSASLGDSVGAAGQPHLDVQATAEGVVIDLTDGADFSMFDIGSAIPDPRVVVLMQKIAATLAKTPGEVIVRGHTDGRPFHTDLYDNWRLSAARAHMAYYMLVRGGLDEKRVVRIEGYADRDLRVPGDPYAAENRRIEILLRKAGG